MRPYLSDCMWWRRMNATGNMSLFPLSILYSVTDLASYHLKWRDTPCKPHFFPFHSLSIFIYISFIHSPASSFLPSISSHPATCKSWMKS